MNLTCLLHGCLRRMLDSRIRTTKVGLFDHFLNFFTVPFAAVNYGGMMLRSLFERWPRSSLLHPDSCASVSLSPSNCNPQGGRMTPLVESADSQYTDAEPATSAYLSLPGHTPLIIWYFFFHLSSIEIWIFHLKFSNYTSAILKACSQFDFQESLQSISRFSKTVCNDYILTFHGQ